MVPTAMPPELTRTSFAQHLVESNLLAKGQRIAVAFSGGRDSVALLHLLVSLREEWQLDLIAVHLDHRMREGSGADADWVMGVCRAWGVGLVAACAARPLRSEVEGRRARYALLRRVARAFRVDAVATAHHRDDQAETVLMRLARGTGVRGLRGIAVKRGRLVRPLLAFDRAAIDDYLAREKLTWREDPTNRDPRYQRNRVRAELLPALGPQVASALAAVADNARALEGSWAGPLEEMVAAAVTPVEGGFLIARDALLGYDPPARTRLLRALCRRLGVVPTRAATEAAVGLIDDGESGSGVDLGGGVRLERGMAELRLGRPATKRPLDAPLAIATDEGSGRAVIGGRVLEVEWARAPESAVAPIGRSALGVVVSLSRLPLELRSWRPGDRIRLPAGSRKLKKLFNDWRVERPERGRTPVLADASGRILWIAGRAAAVDAATAGEPLLRISVRDAELE